MLDHAAELVRRGHHVLVWTTEASRAMVEASGAELVANPAFEDADIHGRLRRALGTLPSPPGPFRGGKARVFWERRARELAFRREVVESALRYARALEPTLDRLKPDVVVAEGFCFGAGYAAERKSIPFATVGTDPSFSLNAWGSLAFPPQDWMARVPGEVFRRVVDAAIPMKRTRRTLGLDDQTFTAELYASMVSRRLHLVSATTSFMRFPSAPGHVFVGPSSFSPPSPPADVVTGARTVLVTGSTTGHPRAVLAFRRVVEALKTTRHDVVIATGSSVISAELPPNVRVVSGFVSHDELIPRTGAVVSHGGWGTVGRALRAGVPVLVTPAFGPQPMIGARLRQLGMAEVLAPEAITPASLEQALDALLDDPRLRERAAQEARALAGIHSASLAADALEALVDAMSTKAEPVARHA